MSSVHQPCLLVVGEPEPELHAGVKLGRHTLEVIFKLLLGRHDGDSDGDGDCGSDVRDVHVKPAASSLQLYCNDLGSYGQV